MAAVACDPSPAPAPADARVFRDGLGREVALAVPASRTVSLAPSNTEILFAIGAGDQVIARDDYSDYPSEAARRRRIGSGPSLDLEAVVALKPDVILAAEIYSPEQVRSIERLGLPVFLVANPVTFDGLFGNVRLLGKITGREAEASRLAASLEARVRAVAARVQRAARRPRVFYELDATDPSQPWTAGPGTFLDTLLELAGGENFAGSQGPAFPRISAERLIREEPEIIVLGDSRSGVTPESVRERAGWEGLAAVKNGKVYSFDDDLASRPGPRLVNGLETLAKLLHPELFPE